MSDLILLQWSDESDIKTSIDEDRQTISMEECRFCLHEPQGNEKQEAHGPYRSAEKTVQINKHI